MATDFDEFGRGDLVFSGGSMGEVVNGRCHIANGGSLVKTLRRGVAGFHKGTIEGSITFNQAILKAGMKEAFVSAILKTKPIKIMAVLADNLRIEVEGILAAGDFSFGENAMVSGDFTLGGRITYTSV